MSLSVETIKNLPKPLLASIVVTTLTVVGGGAVIFFLLLPLRVKSATAKKEVVALETTLATMKGDIKTSEEQSQEKVRLADARDEWVTTGTLKPEELSNSMRMGAKALMMPLAQKTGFQLDNVKEVPAILLRLPTPPPETLYARQPIEFVGYGSFQQIIRFIRATEEKYPLTILSGLVIIAQQKPEIHKAIITFEWPVKHAWLGSGPVR